MCDMCSSQDRTYKIEVEGSILNVCEKCASFGKVVGKVKQEMPEKKKKKLEKEAERRYLKKLRTDHNITDQRWSEIEPTLTDMIKSGRVDLEIEQYIREHTNPKN